MPKFLCKCGHWINLGDIPSPNQMMIISDNDFDKFNGLINSEDLYKAMDLVVICNKCDRLYIFVEGYNNPPKVYKRDD